MRVNARVFKIALDSFLNENPDWESGYIRFYHDRVLVWRKEYKDGTQVPENKTLLLEGQPGCDKEY